MSSNQYELKPIFSPEQSLDSIYATQWKQIRSDRDASVFLQNEKVIRVGAQLSVAGVILATLIASMVFA
ncbi:MAG: hypothetical protein AAF902_02780 [Chloroflexota bacterium]